MNCANHPDIPAVAYCRTCGKPLCANCTRSVQGVIYCETCLADRLHGTQPPITPPPTFGWICRPAGERQFPATRRIQLSQACSRYFLAWDQCTQANMRRASPTWEFSFS